MSGHVCPHRGNCPFPETFYPLGWPSDVKTNPLIWDKQQATAVFHRALTDPILLVFIFLSKIPSWYKFHDKIEMPVNLRNRRTKLPSISQNVRKDIFGTAATNVKAKVPPGWLEPDSA